MGENKTGNNFDENKIERTESHILIFKLNLSHTRLSDYDISIILLGSR